MSLSIRPPTSAIDMDTHLHRYRKSISLIIGSKIAIDKIILVDECLKTNEKLWNFQNISQGNKLWLTRPNIHFHRGWNVLLVVLCKLLTTIPSEFCCCDWVDNKTWKFDFAIDSLERFSYCFMHIMNTVLFGLLDFLERFCYCFVSELLTLYKYLANYKEIAMQLERFF